MAVQAQYRSNLLPFCSVTSRSVDPEMNKAAAAGLPSDVQARQGGPGFLDQHHALFFPASTANSNLNTDQIIGNTPLPKRARDGGADGGGTTTAGFLNRRTLPLTGDQQQQHLASTAFMSSGMITPAPQPMLPSQVLMAQDDVPPVSMVSTGLRLSLEDQNQMQMQQQRHTSRSVIAPLSDELDAVLKLQRDEIDRYLAVQSEHLRRSIAEFRRRHIRSLVSAAEESASIKLREKQSELDRASRTRSDLEFREARASSECAAWQAKARASDAAVAALRAQLERAAADLTQREAHGCGASTSAADGEGAGSDAASACVDPRREEMERQAGSTSSRPAACASSVHCRQCGSAGATVVLLPCRHLCLCTSCSRDPALPAVCPVCFCARSVAVEVFFS